MISRWFAKYLQKLSVKKKGSSVIHFQPKGSMTMRRDDFLTQPIKPGVWVLSPVVPYLPVMSLHWIDLVFTFR
ncbi:hypothetical protein CMK12_00185 [Candidatus Poribacteria bacterium]|nr:hypothetical protein [Candidatus Poribacteria bacterium]